MKKSIGPKTIVFPTPVWIVGSYDKNDTPNAAAVAWGGICSNIPPCVAISLRAATYTHGNITARKAFTVSVPSESHAREADYFGIATGAKEDKFARAGLTPVGSDVVDAPYVGEFPLVLECALLQTHELGKHTQFVGEIIDVKADEAVLAEDGLPDIEKVKPICFSPSARTYHAIGKLLGKAYSIGREI